MFAVRTLYSKYFEGLEPVDTINEWGVGSVKGSAYHFSRMVAPMHKFKTPEQVWNSPLPDIMADYR